VSDFLPAFVVGLSVAAPVLVVIGQAALDLALPRVRRVRRAA
jgi:hypothetical protein